MLTRLVSLLWLAIALSGVGCQSCNKGAATRVKVVVSLFPVYDLTRRIAGPDADVTLIVPPARSPHGFEPAPEDKRIATSAKLGVMVGLGLDSWLETLMKDSPGARVLKVGDRVPTLPTTDDPLGAIDYSQGASDRDKAQGREDPHVWLDPQRAQLIARAIAEELGRIDGAHALAYRQRATELDTALATLDSEVEGQLRALSRKDFIPFHGSFGYFAERYRLSILAVVETAPGTAPPESHKTKVLTLIKDKHVPVLFREPTLDPAPAEALASEAKVPALALDPVGGSAETDSYEKLIRFNAKQLEAHLK